MSACDREECLPAIAAATLYDLRCNDLTSVRFPAAKAAAMFIGRVTGSQGGRMEMPLRSQTNLSRVALGRLRGWIDEQMSPRGASNVSFKPGSGVDDPWREKRDHVALGPQQTPIGFIFAKHKPSHHSSACGVCSPRSQTSSHLVVGA